MRRHGLSRHHRDGQVSAASNSTNNNPNSSNSRPIINSPSSPPLRTSSSFRADRSNTNVANPRFGARMTNPNTNSPIIMTKAQIRRRNAMLAHSTNTIRSVSVAETNVGSTIATRNVHITNNNNIPNSNPLTIRTTLAPKRRNASRTETSSIRSDATVSVPVRIVNRAMSKNPPRRNGSAAQPEDNVPSSFSIFKYRRPKNRVTFDIPNELDGKDAVYKVLNSEKILPRILTMMNWNEILPLRSVCKAWFEIIESNPKVNALMGIIILRSSVESKMAIYNQSAVTWTKFRFIGPVIFDMTKPVQNEFWGKHGPSMVHLEINNRAMTLTGLVEILARCPKLETFKCNWTPEMYSFNSELIKKYYGIHFNNGTFANLQHLTIECSSSLTDSALWSILKWCGGSIKTLSLTAPPDEDVLTRLKPRWSIESIKNYFDRFGYTGNLQFLDFSWSNLSSDDILSLCSINMNLRGIVLNYCKLDDEALQKLLRKHGETIEIFKIEGTSFTDSIFGKEVLPKVKVLHIGGVKGFVRNLSFLKDMPHLEELSCHNTQWLEQTMILKPFNSKVKKKLMKSLDFGGGIKHPGNKNLDPNLNKTWFSDFIGLIANVKELNLSQWSLYGTNMNFRNICQSMILLEKLVVRDWEQLTDVGTTGLYEEEVHQDWGNRTPIRPRVFLGLLKRLKVLDLSGTSITDATINLSMYLLKNLRSIALDGTRVTDNGLRALINKVTSLDRVSVSKCPRISLSQPRFKRPDGRMVVIGKI